MLSMIDFSSNGYFVNYEIPDFIDFQEEKRSGGFNNKAFSFMSESEETKDINLGSLGGSLQDENLFDFDQDFSRKCVLILNVLLDFISNSKNHPILEESFCLETEINKIKTPSKTYALSGVVISNSIMFASKVASILQDDPTDYEEIHKFFSGKNAGDPKSMKSIMNYIKDEEKFGPVAKIRAMGFFVFLNLNRLAGWSYCKEFSIDIRKKIELEKKNEKRF